MKKAECFGRGMLRKTAPSSHGVIQSLEMSREFIRVARENLGIRSYAIAVFSAYTAMFHAARAVLFRDGVKEHSHVCIVAYVGETYPELQHLAKRLDHYRVMRHATLYSLDASADEEDAVLAVKHAKGFLKDMEGFLRDQG